MTELPLLTFVVFVICAVLVCYAQFQSGGRQALLRCFPWLQQSWTANPTFSYCTTHAQFSLLVLGLVEVKAPGYFWWAAVWFGMMVLVKEYLYDFVFEQPAQTNGDNLEDVLGYYLGILLAIPLHVFDLLH